MTDLTMGTQAALNAKQERIEELEAERDRYRRLSLTCFACGLECADLDALKTHCPTCPQHPIAAVTAERDALQRFKNWCHSYLDAHGVPHHPPGCHGAEGCRIGDRMDWLMDRLRTAVAERDALRATAGELAAVLRNLEWSLWVGFDDNREPKKKCPICGVWKGEAHCDRCSLFAALAPDAPQRALARLEALEGAAEVLKEVKTIVLGYGMGTVEGPWEPATYPSYQRILVALTALERTL